jgi:dTDP-4-dehydrorhamnose reductase
MKILIIGSSGSLGKKLFKLLKKKHQIVHTGLKKRKYNLNNKKIIKNLLKIGNPEIVINCAGIVNIDECEKYKTLAYKSNYLIVKSKTDTSSKITKALQLNIPILTKEEFLFSMS